MCESLGDGAGDCSWSRKKEKDEGATRGGWHGRRVKDGGECYRRRWANIAVQRDVG